MQTIYIFFEAELDAILSALQHVDHRLSRRAIILTNSLSSIHALKDPCVVDDVHLLTSILARAASVSGREGEIILHWFPRHGGISENQRADTSPPQPLHCHAWPWARTISRYSLEEHEATSWMALAALYGTL